MADSQETVLARSPNVKDLLYRRSKEYAERLYVAHLKAKHVPVPKQRDEFSAEVDAVHSRLLKKYPYRLLI